MSKFWSDIVKKIEPYVPGEQPKDKKIIKINTNENPYPPSPKVLEAIKQAADESLRLYPAPNCDDLRETIAGYYNLEKEQTFVGNGSDELLGFAFMAFFNPGKPILFADITYSFYPVYSELFKIDYELIPLEEDFSINLDDYYKPNGGIIIANPNAPTSKHISADSIKGLLKKNTESVVIIDEAYIDFGGESAVKYINDFPNLLIINTLSKSRSLAGLRVGFALGNKDLIEGINRVKNSFNSYTLDRLALVGAQEAFKDEAYFKETRSKIMSTRGRVVTELEGIGFKVLDSKANFIFITHKSFSAIELFKQLRDRDILVRYFKKPRIDNYLRVSIGTDEEMKRFMAALKEILI
jgi:histidinol-phosphate aminotransferase